MRTPFQLDLADLNRVLALRAVRDFELDLVSRAEIFDASVYKLVRVEEQILVGPRDLDESEPTLVDACNSSFFHTIYERCT